MKPRAVIWGAGVACPAGTGIAEVFASIETAKPCTDRILSFDSSHFPPNAAGEVKGPCGVERMDTGIDRKSVFLEAALGQLAEKGILSRFRPEKRHFFVGMGLDYFDLPGIREYGSDDRNIHRFMLNSVDSVRGIAGKHEISGDVSVNVTACVASSQAIGLAFRSLVRDQAAQGNLILAGGADSMVNPVHYMGFYKLGALSQKMDDPSRAARPFDRRRSGLVLGEGAALFAMSRAQDAPGEAIMAEIVGYASSMDAYMITDPDPTGEHVANAARSALRQAGIDPTEIDCVHLHGTSTVKNDLAEAAAMKKIFGGRSGEVPVYSMKGQIGHTISACGAIELLPVLYSLATNSVPPTVNFDEPDPQVPLNVIKKTPLKMPINAILKINAAFGGQNTALVVKRYDS